MFVAVQVEVVEDGELPDGIDRVLVERSCGDPLMLVSRRVSGSLLLLGARERRLRAVG